MYLFGKSVNTSASHGWRLSGLINRLDRGAQGRATGTRMLLIIQATQVMDLAIVTAGAAALRIVVIIALTAMGAQIAHSVFKAATRKAAGRCG